MKRFLLILATFFISKTVLADHITGGEMFYTYLGISSNGQYQYRVTLKLFRNCGNVGAPLDPAAAIAVFDKGTRFMVLDSSIIMTRSEELQLMAPGPCITNAPTVCYEVGYYEFEISLPASIDGYTVAYQRCCRIKGINNLVDSESLGGTYTADIPGTSSMPDAPENNSARFIGTDTVIICGGYPFTYSFAAIDPDGNDELRYSFCNAFIGGGPSVGAPGGPSSAAPNPPTAMQ